MFRILNRSLRPGRGHAASALAVLAAALLFAALFYAGSSGADQEDATADSWSFKVVVHEDNAASSMSRDDVSKLFLKKIRTWPDQDVSVVPIDQNPKSEVREEFSKEIHGKKVSQIDRYWQRSVFSGRDSPPRALDSDAAVLAFVRTNRGAIGYVAADADLGDGVKTLKIE